MLNYTITFLVIALVAGVFGFIGVTGQIAIIAKVLFFISLALSALSLTQGRRPPA